MLFFPQRYNPDRLAQPRRGSFAPSIKHAETISGQARSSTIQPRHCCCKHRWVCSPGDAALLCLRGLNVGTLPVAATTLLTRQCQSENNASVMRRNRESMVRYLDEAEVTDRFGFLYLQCHRSAFYNLRAGSSKGVFAVSHLGKRTSLAPSPELTMSFCAGNSLPSQRDVLSGLRKGVLCPSSLLS